MSADIRNLLNAGADKVSMNTSAVNEPGLIRQAANMFGSQCIVVAIDAKRVGDHWEVFTHGGRNATGRMRSSGPRKPRPREREKFY